VPAAPGEWYPVSMTWFVIIGAIGLALWPLVVSIRRSTDLFVVRVRAGQAHFVRGRMPHGLLHDIADVVNSPAIAEAELRAVRRAGQAELVVRGEVGSEQRQRLRNVVGCYSLPRILAGGPPARRRRS
jgi:hypothetical protein